MPVMMILLVAAIVSRAPAWLTVERARGARLVLLLVLFAGLMVAVLRQPYLAAKHTIFLYPLLALLMALALREWLAGMRFAPRAAAAAFYSAVAGLMALSDDYGVRHLLDIDSAEVNFRLMYPRERQYHYWYRMDYRTPAEYVNDHAAPGDRIVTTMLPVAFYLDRLDAHYMDVDDIEFTVVSSCGGSKEMWSGADLIYREPALSAYLSAGGPVWLIVRSDGFHYQRAIEGQLAERYELRYASVDGRVNVYLARGQT
jgi:hypothetical protein